MKREPSFRHLLYKFHKSLPDCIAVSGTPCTGKTFLAKKLSLLLGFVYIGVNKVIKNYNLKEGYDKKRKSIIIDIDKLNKILIDVIKKNKKAGKKTIIDSHFSHFLPKSAVDLCIITKTELKTLKKRMEKRHWSKQKIRENLDSEIFDVCFTEALENGHKIIIIDTTKTHDYLKIFRKILKSSVTCN